jgi:hypothetical protein
VDDATLDPVLEELRALTGRFIQTAGGATEPFGLYVLAANRPESELARHIEREVFGEYFGNTPELLVAEYGAYEAATLFLCVIDHRRRLPAGMMRLVLPSPAGLKSLADIEMAWDQRPPDVLARTGLAFDDDRVWDITTLAAGPDYRGRATNGLVSLALYQGVVQAALRCNVRWFVTILDLIVLDLIQQATSKPFQLFAALEPLRYLDSPASLPVFCDLEEYLPRLQTADPSMYEILADGRGLEAAVRPPDWERALAGLLPAGRAQTA